MKMAGKRQDTKEQFIKRNHLETIFEKASAVDPELWNSLQKIREHYSEYSKHCESIAQQTVLEILGDKKADSIHSVRMRIKDIDSLLSKIIKKKAYLSKEIQEDYDIEKYRPLDEKNYYKIITDISGIRILIRYREQWEHVHDWLWGKYYRGEEYYLKDYVADYKSNVGKSFIVEKPKVYYRNDRDRILYEQIGKDVFDFRKSDEGYNSIHYLVNVDGKYIEVQMRTILDEAWSECTHDIVYKSTNKAQIAELEYLSQCLSQQTIAAETITNLIYEKVNKNGTIFGKKTNVQKKDIKNIHEPKVIRNSVETRMHLLEEYSLMESFDGDIDSII